MVCEFKCNDFEKNGSREATGCKLDVLPKARPGEAQALLWRFSGAFCFSRVLLVLSEIPVQDPIKIADFYKYPL